MQDRGQPAQTTWAEMMSSISPSRQRLSAANAEIVALRSEIAALKALAANLQKSVEQLQAAQKAAGDKKPGTQ
jgi:prefoldin subunit 5